MSYINIEELDPFKFRVDQYNIYHVYFYDDEGRINRYFLGGNKMQEWFYKNLSIKIIDKNKEEIIKLFREHKKSLKWTLDLDSLYPR